MYKAEYELCMGTLNDKLVDHSKKKHEPKHWKKSVVREREQVVMTKSGVARVRVSSTADPLEPFIAEGAHMLEDLSDEARQALLSGDASGDCGAAGPSSLPPPRVGEPPPPSRPGGASSCVFGSTKRRRTGAGSARGGGGGSSSIATAATTSTSVSASAAARAAPAPARARGAQRLDQNRLSFAEDDGDG